MHVKRTRFAGDIISDFLPPKQTSNKVIIFCGGMPGVPVNNVTMEMMHKRGYWSFYPRYRGTWESDGYFLDHDPTDDIRDVVESLDHPFTDYWSGEEFHIKNPEIYVVGISFGGPAAILLSSHTKVKKIVSICGVVDWTADSPDEPLDWLFEQFLPNAFGKAYRLQHPDDWKQLERGELYQPMNHMNNIDEKKILHVHATDDTLVPYDSVVAFSKQAGTTVHTLRRGGHYISGSIRSWRTWRVIKKHFAS
jgi:esterase/lipase